MTENPVLIPAVQMDDRSLLEGAMERLQRNGYKTEIKAFSDIPASERTEWMVPENGGYIFLIEKNKFQPAMEMLGIFFGYSG